MSVEVAATVQGWLVWEQESRNWQSHSPIACAAAADCRGERVKKTAGPGGMAEVRDGGPDVPVPPVMIVAFTAR